MERFRTISNYRNFTYLTNKQKGKDNMSTINKSGNITLENKTVFLTGVAGFIGSNLAKWLFNETSNVKIVGIDNVYAKFSVPDS